MGLDENNSIYEYLRARYRAAALTAARLFFGDFLLAKQKKVTALSGA